jgi:hypothetical protein
VDCEGTKWAVRQVPRRQRCVGLYVLDSSINITSSVACPLFPVSPLASQSPGVGMRVPHVWGPVSVKVGRQPICLSVCSSWTQSTPWQS